MTTILDYIKTQGKSPKEKKPEGASVKVLKENNMGKQIMQNMESVMKSLKRRSKHKKHQKKLRAAKGGGGTANCCDSDTGSTASGSTAGVGDDIENEDQGAAGGAGPKDPEEELRRARLAARAKRKSHDQTQESTTTTTTADKSASTTSDKKNAFQLMMLNGKASGNPESPKKPSPSTTDTGKRRLSSGQQPEKTKRRSVKGEPVESVPEGGGGKADTSPKSPAKKRRKKKLFECFVETIEPKKPPPAPPALLQTPKSNPVIVEDSPMTASRPRRSCAGNVTYQDTSPVSSTSTSTTTKPTAPVIPKAKPSTPSTPKTTTLRKQQTKKEIPPVEPEVIDLEKSSPEDTANPPGTPTTAAKAKKLAPMFCKAVPKPHVDQKVREARQSFLMSDIPEKMRQEIEKKKQVQAEVEHRQLFSFPEVSHVPVHSGEVYLAVYEDEALFPRLSPNEIPLEETQRLYSALSVDKGEKVGGTVPALSPLKTVNQRKNFVRGLKDGQEGDFPSFKFYKMLSKRAETESEAGKVFSDRFAPSDSREFVFNLTAVKELKEYLESFNAQVSENTSSYETDDECSNSSSVWDRSRQTMVLFGASATGKTSAVYAIANELNYNVIEINASSKRNGSKVLHKLMEATQSHKLATTAAATNAKTSLSRKIVRKMEREETKMSIIFIEDVDLIFNEDNGFLAAITQLMSFTKRPIILTTNNRTSPSLKRFFESSPNFKFLHFRRAIGSRVDNCLTYLQLVGVTGGCNFDADYLKHLYVEVCGQDLRQALLQLQIVTETREIPLKWTGETDRVDIPCCNLEEDEVDGEEGCADLALTMESLCVADGWMRRDEKEEEMRAEFEEMCLLGNSLLDSRCDGTFYPKVPSYTGHQSMFYNYTSRHMPKSSSGNTIAMDTEPLLRTICRSEATRRDAQRTSSRFLHYLLRERDLDMPMFGAERTAKEDLEALQSSCAIFKETTT